jgi:hypothetical protein
MLIGEINFSSFLSIITHALWYMKLKLHFTIFLKNGLIMYKN